MERSADTSRTTPTARPPAPNPGGGAPPSTGAPNAIAAGIAIAAVAAATYANALGNRFALDDNDVILNNPLVHQLSGVWRAFVHSYWPDAAGAGQYRPLTIATFAADWVMSGGSPAWMHAVNVIIHVAVCLLVWRLLMGLTSATGALIGALVFAVHPVHVEAVAGLVGRSDLLCAALTIAALLAHRGDRWAAPILYAAALGAKESGVVFVGLAVASDLLLPDRRGAVAAPVRAARSAALAAVWRRRWLYSAYVAVTAAYLLVLGVLFRDQPLVRVAEVWQHASATERWLTAIRVVPEYVRLLFFPMRLHIEYTPQVIDVARGLTPGVGLGILVVAAAGVLAFRTRARAPLVAFALVVFACSIAPVANVFFPSGVVLAERTLYLPSVAVAILVAWVWDLAVARRPMGVSAASARRALWPAGVVVGLVLTALAIRTWTRTPVWRSNKSVMVASLLGEPESYRAHERVADVLYRAGDVDGALREYAVARSLYPYDPLLYQGPAALMVARGPGGTEGANRLLDSARALDPSPYADAMRRSWVRYAAGDYAGSMAWSRSAYLMARDSVDAVMVLTQAAQRINDVADATVAFRLALADHPRNRALHRSYAAMLASVGDSASARRELALADSR